MPVDAGLEDVSSDDSVDYNTVDTGKALLKDFYEEEAMATTYADDVSNSSNEIKHSFHSQNEVENQITIPLKQEVTEAEIEGTQSAENIYKDLEH